MQTGSCWNQEDGRRDFILQCVRCGAEEMDVPLVIAAYPKGFPLKKDAEKSVWHWSQVPQKVCPVCGAQHVSVTCSPKRRPE